MQANLRPFGLENAKTRQKNRRAFRSTSVVFLWAILLFGKGLSLSRRGLCLHRFGLTRVVCLDQGHVYKMLGEEPDLKLLGSNALADDQVVGAVIARVRSLLRHGVRFLEDEFMSFEQARDLHRGFFASARRPRDQGGFGDVVRHGDADAAQELNALGYGVHQFVLLAVVLVEQKMELVERVAGDLPVVLFVHVAQRDRIGEKLVQVFDAVGANLFIEADGELRNLVVRLNFARLLMQNRTRPLGARLDAGVTLSGVCFAILGTHNFTVPFRYWIKLALSLLGYALFGEGYRRMFGPKAIHPPLALLFSCLASFSIFFVFLYIRTDKTFIFGAWVSSALSSVAI